MTHYYRFDTYIGILWCEIIRIPYYFIDCRNYIDLTCETSIVTKDQPIYSSVIKYKYYPILGKHNDRVIMDLIDKGTDKE